MRDQGISQARKDAIKNIVISNDEQGVVTVADFVENRKNPVWLNDGISFSNISLGNKIMHSDEVYSLLDKDLDSLELNRILDYLFKPYPIGLWNDEVGLFIANAIFADNTGLWQNFDSEGAYHGQHVIWSKPMSELELGLMRQIRYAQKRKNYKDKKRLENFLSKVIKTKRNLGALSNSELWTWESGEKDTIKAVSFTQGEGGQPAGNPQLWGTSDAGRYPEHKKIVFLDAWMETLTGDNVQHIFSGRNVPSYINGDGKDALTFQGLLELEEFIENGKSMKAYLKNGLILHVRNLINEGSNGFAVKEPVLALLDGIANISGELQEDEIHQFYHVYDIGI